MKIILKKALSMALALVLVVGILAPIQAQATEPGPQPLSTEEIEAITDLFQGVADALGVTTITLTPEARAYALSDFEYLASKIMEVAPTQNIVARRGVFYNLASHLVLFHQIIYSNIPVPSITFMDMGERWLLEPENDLHIAADYLFTLLAFLAGDLGGLGHMSPQPPHIVWHYFFAAAHTLHGIAQQLYGTGYTLADAPVRDDDLSGEENAVLALIRQQQLYYSIFNNPSLLWFYDINPADFDLDSDLLGALGSMNPDNITTAILEPGRVAYFHIESFLNNIPLDSETLFPFFSQIQDYEHLIIDLRGNGGGMVASFPTNVISMLIDETVNFSYAEFFIASDLTTEFFVNPASSTNAMLYGIFPAYEYVRANNLHQFNQDDLALLDYAIVWEIEISPADDNIPFSGEIWLLVDGSSASASEMAAKISINTGFATVVGEPTAGVTFTVHTFAVLPNTGIAFRIDLGYTVDSYGRSIEEFGVIPQILNTEGMDALENVLEIIGFAADDTDAETNEGAAGIHRRYVNGIPFVPVRMTAYAYGWTVEWDGANNAAILTNELGYELVLIVSSYHVFIDNGVMFIPLEFALEFFVV